MALSAYLIGPQLNPANHMVTILSANLLKIFLIFYVIQGVGIFVALLNLAKIRGFTGFLFFFFVLIQGPFIFALLGLFDMWVNFRKFFKKKIEKYRGDN